MWRGYGEKGGRREEGKEGRRKERREGGRINIRKAKSSIEK